MDRGEVRESLSRQTEHFSECAFLQLSFRIVHLCLVQRSLGIHRCVKPDFDFTVGTYFVDKGDRRIFVITILIGIKWICLFLLLWAQVVDLQII